MGLDMCLSRKTYVKNWGFQKPEEQYEITVKKNGKEVDYINKDNISFIVEEAAYWRKFNALHNWFVQNVQDGIDDCKEYFVSKEDLKTLYDLCKEVKDKPTEAKNLLPTTSGFFFGDTEYDERYFKDLDDTIEILEKILSEEESDIIQDYYYSSSW